MTEIPKGGINEQDPELEAILKELPAAKKKKRRPWSRKRKLLTIGASAVIVLFLLTRILGSGGEVPNMVTTVDLKQGTIQNKLTLSGPVYGTDSAEVVSNLHAEIESILVKEGDVVEKGQVLARLNTEDVERDVLIAQNAYDIAVANHDEAQKTAVSEYQQTSQDYKAANDNLQRIRILFETGSSSAVEYETALNAMNDEKRRLDSFELEDGRPVAAKSYGLQVKNAQYELEQKQKVLDQTEITSPIAGTVVRINSRVGRFANEVDNDKPLFAIDNLETLELKINVSEYSIGKVQIGQKATIRADILAGNEEEGIVINISPTGEEKGNGSSEMVIPITIQVLSEESGLIAGITARAELVLEEAQDAFIVPVSAIFQKDEDSCIAVVEESFARLIPVETGVESEIEVQVTPLAAEDRAAVLTEGMRVITNPDPLMTDGQIVLEQPVR